MASYFDLKDENADEFIGLKITDTEDDMFIEPLLFVSIGSEGGIKRIRYQSWYSNGSVNKKIAVLYSQLVAVVDRCNDEMLIKINVVRLLLEFAYAGFQHFAMRIAVKRYLCRYSYCVEVMAVCALSFSAQIYYGGIMASQADDVMKLVSHPECTW